MRWDSAEAVDPTLIRASSKRSCTRVQNWFRVGVRFPLAASEAECHRWRNDLPHEIPAPGTCSLDPLIFESNPLKSRLWTARVGKSYDLDQSVDWDTDSSDDPFRQTVYFDDETAECPAVGYRLLKLRASDGDVTEHVEPS